MRNQRKVRQGIVVSDKMNKSIVVRVNETKMHPLYGKTIKVSNKFHAHDELNAAKTGDEVLIMETRPISKTKTWRLVEIKKKGAGLKVESVENTLENINKAL